MSDKRQPPLTYRDAGVDISAANALVEDIKAIAKRTHRPGQLGSIGGFGGLFELPQGYKQPVLVSGTDGVGTKLKLAIEANQHDSIGIDLVAMCVNDIITIGAEPLFFLDYYATGHLDQQQAKSIIAGIGQGCELAQMALTGGETAELPGLYQAGEYDLAGFAVGVVEKAKIIDGSQVKPGDALIAIASSGPHANGYSLIRHIITITGASLDTKLNQSTLGEILLTPTRIYVASIKALAERLAIRALAHITGGGLLENIPRVLPPGTQAIIDSTSWQRPAIFNWLQEKGNVSSEEMARTFNLGIGMIVCVDPADADEAIGILQETGERAWLLGHIKADENAPPSVIIK